MRYLWRLIPRVGALAAIGVLWWAGLPVLAVLVTLVSGLAGLLYLIAGAGRAGDGRTEQEREGYERFLRDVPPSS